MSPAIIMVIVAVALLLSVQMVVLKRLLYVVTPNQVLVLSGRRRRAGSGALGYRSIRGGRALRIPMLEQADVLDLSNIPIQLERFEVRTRGGMRLQLTLVAHVRLAGAEPLLQRALECFLGRGRDEIAAVAQQVLIGVLLAMATTTLPDDIPLDTQRFEQELIAELEHDLSRLGLELDGLRIKEVSDVYGYVEALRSR